MLKKISRFCSHSPWIVILVVFGITALFIQQIADNLRFEADVTKSLPANIEAAKSDDYYKKNFNYKDMMLIGVGKPDGSIMEAEVLKKIEQIQLDIRSLKVPKTFDSVLTGRQETLIQSIGIDTENISSIANLEDAILDKETGSVVSGSVIEKLKKDKGIPSKPGEEERLPEEVQDLKQLIPELTQRILQDRSFKNRLLSEDMHASTISVPMLRKWDYEKRYAILELSTALDKNLLKARFQGKTSTFPFEIYGKTIDKIQVNDDFIERQVNKTRKGLSAYLTNALEDTAENDPVLKDMLNRELTVESFQTIMTHIEGRDFFIVETMGLWTNFYNDIWDFTLSQIDPFSRENLEFQLHDVKNIFDFDEVYRMVSAILDKHRLEGVNYYVAGTPVVIGVIGPMMSKDTGTLVPIAVLVIFFILGVSFRSFRGVIIPALTVVLSVIWTMGVMATLGIAIKMGTTMLPIILLGIGTAYGIHLLNRYSEDAATHTDRRELVQKSMNNVGVAVIMAALTTMAGFSSLATSGLSMIQEFGAFAAVGVGIALILSLTLTPSLLVLWKLPRQKTVLSNGVPVNKKEMILLRIMRILAEKVSRNPGQTSALMGAVFIVSIILATGNQFEGSMMKNFDEKNPLFLSDQFLNENLTGTTNINLLFKFRDRINLDSPQAQSDFRQRLDGFSAAWMGLTHGTGDLETATQLVKEMQTDAEKLPGSLDTIISHLKLMQ
ncbi:MAG: MMPL family transporter, partial [Deltaproteobacteria bacterium]|nr:MMPL family transporter [Deltaproteobacteria bacterium]